MDAQTERSRGFLPGGFMGVKEHWLLATSRGLWIGPAAYYKLLKRYKTLYSGGIANTPPSTLLVQGGWRKNISRVFQAAVNAGENAGVLRSLKVRNPGQDPRYREALAYVATNTQKANPRQQTPNEEVR